MTLLTELAALHDKPEQGDFKRLDTAINALRDETAALNFATERGHNRLLSLIVAKLDEARGLAVLYEIEINRLATVDRSVLLAAVQPGETDTTVTTVGNGGESV